MTPQEAADLANRFLTVPPEYDKQILEFLNSAPVGHIRDFIHRLDPVSGVPRYFNTARIALDFRLSKDADLIAEKLSNQTDKLIKYTKGLWAFTLALVIVAILQIIIMVMDYCSKTH